MSEYSTMTTSSKAYREKQKAKGLTKKFDLWLTDDQMKELGKNAVNHKMTLTKYILMKLGIKEKDQ